IILILSRRMKMKKTWLIVLALCMAVIVGCSSGDSESSSEPKEKVDGVPDEVQDNVRIGVVRNLPSDDHMKQFLDGAQKEGEAFGFEVDTFISDGDDRSEERRVGKECRSRWWRCS